MDEIINKLFVRYAELKTNEAQQEKNEIKAYEKCRKDQDLLISESPEKIKQNYNGWPPEPLPATEDCPSLTLETPSNGYGPDYIDEMEKLSISFMLFDTKEAEENFYRDLEKKETYFIHGY